MLPASKAIPLLSVILNTLVKPPRFVLLAMQGEGEYATLAYRGLSSMSGKVDLDLQGPSFGRRLMPSQAQNLVMERLVLIKYGDWMTFRSCTTWLLLFLSAGLVKRMILHGTHPERSSRLGS